jgi:hypothetical protein
MIDLDELLHVFEAHTANRIRIIEGEENEYTKQELIEIINEARIEIDSFFNNLLIPIVNELEEKRAICGNL